MASCKLSAVAALLWLIPVYSVAQAEEPFRSHSDPVKIAQVTVRMSDHGPVVLLQAEGRTIPIFVDLTVALSIESVLSGEKLPRPMTHDLMHTILDAYGGKVTQTVITMQGGTYYGMLTVAFKDRVKVFDSRSSDSIALAVLFKAPILVGRDLLESVGKISEKEKDVEL
ncbi:MAG TPA: bifunctional nuclease family protein [Nitrospira sp.]|nr:bifunctional nuclease family protein [Nitrospira sp.]